MVDMYTLNGWYVHWMVDMYTLNGWYVHMYISDPESDGMFSIDLSTGSIQLVTDSKFTPKTVTEYELLIYAYSMYILV